MRLQQQATSLHWATAAGCSVRTRQCDDCARTSCLLRAAPSSFGQLSAVFAILYTKTANFLFGAPPHTHQKLRPCSPSPNRPPWPSPSSPSPLHPSRHPGCQTSKSLLLHSSHISIVGPLVLPDGRCRAAMVPLSVGGAGRAHDTGCQHLYVFHDALPASC